MAVQSVNVNTEALKARYQMQNAFGNNLRIGGSAPIEKAGGVSGVEYAGGYDYSIPKYKAPEIAGGTHITGLGKANDTGKLNPYFA